MNAKFGPEYAERPLDLYSLVTELHASGRLADADRERLARLGIGSVHPLVFLAEQKIPDPCRPGQILDMDTLLHWLGERTGQAVCEIDPLKINVGAISEVMSRAFAQRHRILAVEVTEDEVVVASAEPRIRSWERNLEHVLRKRIRRVLADPRDIARHAAEFYSMARSVRGARSKIGRAHV